MKMFSQKQIIFCDRKSFDLLEVGSGFLSMHIRCEEERVGGWGIGGGNDVVVCLAESNWKESDEV